MNCMKFGNLGISNNSFQTGCQGSVSIQCSVHSQILFETSEVKGCHYICTLPHVLTVISSMSIALQKRGTFVYKAHKQLELTSTYLQKLEATYFEMI